MYDPTEMRLLESALSELAEGFAGLPSVSGAATDDAAVAAVLGEVARRMQDNFPYHHPLYAGQMMKPPHPVARLAYALAMHLNPNNHALDGGRASSAMEKEAVATIAAMFGWDAHLGHLTGGGTMANLEALWVAGQLHPGKAIVSSSQAHYTHARISGVLHLPFEPVACDDRGRMDLAALEMRLDQGDVGTVVATIGTTGLGAVDPLPGILDLARRYGARVHADAAYGGYFTLAANLGPEARAAFDVLGRVDSLAIDPHKHGLQPYGCGCIVFRDPGVGALYRHDSPYTYFTSDELHLGEISLECSRAGAAAVALWATMRLLPLEPGGPFARGLERGREAALDLYRRLDADPRFLPVTEPELDILCFAPARNIASAISAASRELFDAAARENLHLALIDLPAAMLHSRWPGVEFDREAVTCLRSCLMKPEHAEWTDAIWAILDRAVP